MTSSIVGKAAEDVQGDGRWMSMVKYLFLIPLLDHTFPCRMY